MNVTVYFAYVPCTVPVIGFTIYVFVISIVFCLLYCLDELYVSGLSSLFQLCVLHSMPSVKIAYADMVVISCCLLLHRFLIGLI